MANPGRTLPCLPPCRRLVQIARPPPTGLRTARGCVIISALLQHAGQQAGPRHDERRRRPAGTSCRGRHSALTRGTLIAPVACRNRSQPRPAGGTGDRSHDGCLARGAAGLTTTLRCRRKSQRTRSSSGCGAQAPGRPDRETALAHAHHEPDRTAADAQSARWRARIGHGPGPLRTHDIEPARRRTPTGGWRAGAPEIHPS